MPYNLNPLIIMINITTSLPRNLKFIVVFTPDFFIILKKNMTTLPARTISLSDIFIFYNIPQNNASIFSKLPRYYLTTSNRIKGGHFPGINRV